MTPRFHYLLYILILLFILVFGVFSCAKEEESEVKETSSSSGDGSTGGDGPKTFVGVGYYGTIVTSADLENLDVRTSGTTEQLNAITFGNGVFVVVGNYGTTLFSFDKGAT